MKYNRPEDFPRGDAELKSAWSMAAGELQGIRRCLEMVRRDAGNAFISGHDALAQSLRSLTRNIQDIESDASRQLEAFINLKSPAGPVQPTDASPARESDHAGM